MVEPNYMALDRKLRLYTVHAKRNGRKHILIVKVEYCTFQEVWDILRGSFLQLSTTSRTKYIGLQYTFPKHQVAVWNNHLAGNHNRSSGHVTTAPVLV